MRDHFSEQRQRWYLRGMLGDYVLVKASGLKSSEVSLRRVPETHVLANLDQWLSSPLTARVLYAMCEAMTGRGFPRSGTLALPGARWHLRFQLSEALRSGQLVAFALDPGGYEGLGRGSSSLAKPDTRQPSSRTRPPAPERTWVEIELLGEDGKPIPNERYSLRLPDGQVREGTLNAQGMARVDDISPGWCSVCFPRLDNQAWQPL